MSDIKEGDVVKLKSGGVAMSVEWVDDDSASCVWHDGPKSLRETYRVVVLEKFDSKADAAAYKEARGR